jgi:hypothetical protein
MAALVIIKKPDWTFYPIWIVLTMLSVPIAFIFDYAILQVVEIFVGDIIYVNGVRHITEDYLSMYTFVPIVGLFIGVVQYLLLRRYLPRMGWWVLATAGGWLLGGLLILISRWLNLWTLETFNTDLAFIVMGLSIGVGQWLLLRRRLPLAGWWVGANAVGWGLLALVTGDSLDQFGLLLLGLLPACITGAAFGWLIKYVHPSELQGE